MIRAIALAAALGAASAAAQTPMGADAFEEQVTGRTLTFGTAEGPFGIEEYLPGRRVRWSFLDGDCLDGIWYPQGDAICFAYEGLAGPQCWHFFLDGDQLRATTLDAPDAAPLYVIRESDEPMQCLGPRIGV